VSSRIDLDLTKVLHRRSPELVKKSRCPSLPTIPNGVMGEARIMLMRAPGERPSPAAKQPVEIYLDVDEVDALHDRLKKKGVRISDPLTLQWWGDRTFKVLDPNGYEILLYTNVAEPKPPQGAKLV
jgi:Glyoxalase/Bleomycin resistance protein/Dioxygenase superfamily